MLSFAAPAAAQSPSAGCGGGLPRASTEATQQAFDAVRAIVVDGDAGSVHVTASGGPQTTVSTQACFTLAKPSLSQEVSDGVLRITWRCPRPPLIVVGVARCSRDVAVTAPSATEVSVQVGVGDVEATGIAGATQLTTGVGDARASRSGADRISVSSATGDAVIDAAVPPSEASAVTSVGDAEVGAPAGSYAIDAATAVGDVSVSGLQPDASSPRKLTARTQTGNVRVVAAAAGSAAAVAPPAVTAPARATATIADVLRHGLRLSCTAVLAGTCRVAVGAGGRRVASGARRTRAGQTVTVVARPTARGERLLRRALRARRAVALTIRIAAPGARPVSSRTTLRP